MNAYSCDFAASKGSLSLDRYLYIAPCLSKPLQIRDKLVAVTYDDANVLDAQALCCSVIDR